MSDASTILSSPFQPPGSVIDDKGEGHVVAVQDSSTLSAPQEILPPDGGFDAWMTIAGAWLIQFCTFGYINAFGVYQDYYTREFLTNYTASDVSWIGSFQLAMQYIPGVLVGRAFDAGYLYSPPDRLTLVFVLTSFQTAIISASQALSFLNCLQVFLAQALGMGIAQGMLFLPSLTIVPHHFRRRRALATGIVVTGSSAGGIVMPIMLNAFFHSRIGFANGVRIGAAMIAVLLFIANCMVRTRLPPKSARPTITRQDFFSLIAPHADVAIINAGSIGGRLLPTFLADIVGVYNMLIPCIAASSFLLWAIFGAKTSAGVIIVSLLFGFTSGACERLRCFGPAMSDPTDAPLTVCVQLDVSLIPNLLACLARSMSELGVRMGIAFSVVGIAMLVGTPIDGALLGPNYDWWKPILFCGFCKHASGSLEDVVREAIAQQFEVYGLTEHVPRYRAQDLYPEEAKAELSVEDLTTQFDAFLVEAHRLKARYAPQITLLVGLETEYVSLIDLDRLSELLEHSEGRIEYLVGSVHHVNGTPIDLDAETFQRCLSDIAVTESDGVDVEHERTGRYLEMYFDAQFELMRRVHPEVVGHIDLCRLYTPALRFEDYPRAWFKLERNIKYAVVYGAVFEVNAAALRKGWEAAYPGEDVIELILQRGGRFVLSDDSHGPHAVGLNYVRMAAYLQRVGVNELYVLERTETPNAEGRFVRPVRVKGHWWEHAFWKDKEENS
ncbi:hypothetical protein EW146_g4952 [Bondarzewia mesenterica]|uniref:histidinol-phosphatase n=1 Tax=Bondarzewia mesenterica TaxID=1095465 RepID=A0A4S4LTZ2_9AGAM|nr:hypothetical protein EW146_g4952 [Bondarzewia mesenterica]